MAIARVRKDACKVRIRSTRLFLFPFGRTLSGLVLTTVSSVIMERLFACWTRTTTSIVVALAHSYPLGCLNCAVAQGSGT